MLVDVFPPVLLVQPPNSSSAATLGAGLNPPEAPGTIGVLANAPPVFPHPKSFVFVASGLFTAGLLACSGAAQALSPQTSALEKLVELNEDVGFETAGVVAGGDFAWLEERLNTEFGPAEGVEMAGAGTGAGAGAGLEKSNKSAMADEAGAADGLGGGAGEAKPPKPPELPKDGFV